MSVKYRDLWTNVSLNLLSFAKTLQRNGYFLEFLLFRQNFIERPFFMSREQPNERHCCDTLCQTCIQTLLTILFCNNDLFMLENNSLYNFYRFNLELPFIHRLKKFNISIYVLVHKDNFINVIKS